MKRASLVPRRRSGAHKSTSFRPSFTAESEREKRDWMEALQETIAETLSDYEVAEKIWSNRSNRMCADCRAVNPDWASINLCVVICKNCAGTRVSNHSTEVPHPILWMSW